MYIVLVEILVDTNIFLAVILNEPQKNNIIELTQNSEIISPKVLPYEIGNALSAMLKRQRLNKEQAIEGFHLFEMIPIRLVSVDIEKSLEISSYYNIYAYDAYYLELAKRLKLQLLTLDSQMKDVARGLKIPLLEVA